MRKPHRVALLALGLAALAVVASRVGSGPTSPGEGAAAFGEFAALRGLQAAVAAQERDAGAGQAGQEAEAEQAEPGAPGRTAEQAIVDHNTAGRGPRQPIPFSHRFHSTELRIDCMYCHTGTERSTMGLVPAVDVCMGCHRTAGTGLDPIEELRGYAAREEPIPWVWVNRLPEFVQFPHQPHIRTGIACQTCHGPVEEMPRVYQWAPFTMGWCLECHRQPPQEGDVATDHLLARAFPPPEAPRERQPGSFYPLTIDQNYGRTRAPTDCFACHY